MNTLAGYPYAEIEFTKEGTLFQPQAVDALQNVLTDKQITDLVVISHGWNNDMAEARSLYKNLVTLLAGEIPQRAELSKRRFAVLGVLWPSKKFAEEELIAGGGAASVTTSSDKEELVRRLSTLKKFFDGPDWEALIGQAMTQAASFDADPDAPEQFVALMQTLLGGAASVQANEPEDVAAGSVNTENPRALLTRLSDVRLGEAAAASEGAAELSAPFTMPASGEGAVGLGLSWSGLLGGARNMLNFVTYYQMKARAGKVGTQGLHPVLVRIKDALPAMKLHLIGHSFGARVVTAAIAGPQPRSGLQVNTLTLLQAAFSHYGFAENYDQQGRNGLFINVLANHQVKGPIVISCTHNDKAVGLAYAIASRVARQSGSGLGDKDDFYGEMGANGAQKIPGGAQEHITLGQGSVYDFKAGKLYNLNADHCIQGHSDICQPQVAKAIAASMATE